MIFIPGSSSLRYDQLCDPDIHGLQQFVRTGGHGGVEKPGRSIAAFRDDAGHVLFR